MSVITDQRKKHDQPKQKRDINDEQYKKIAADNHQKQYIRIKISKCQNVKI